MMITCFICGAIGSLTVGCLGELLTGLAGIFEFSAKNRSSGKFFRNRKVFLDSLPPTGKPGIVEGPGCFRAWYDDGGELI